jgi:hypothetical protein
MEASGLSIAVKRPRMHFRREFVVPALVAGIHVLVQRKSWMPGIKPGMTVERQGRA